MGYLLMLWTRYRWASIGVPPIIYLMSQVEKYYDSQMILFRDKSALYGSEKAEGDPPSW